MKAKDDGSGSNSHLYMYIDVMLTKQCDHGSSSRIMKYQTADDRILTVQSLDNGNIATFAKLLRQQLLIVIIITFIFLAKHKHRKFRQTKLCLIAKLLLHNMKQV